MIRPLTVTDFKYGMDRRRSRVAGVPGTLWVGKNVHISRGGDIERAKKFVSTYSLPADTFGFAAIKGQLYVFGSAIAPTMPSGVQYQRCQAPDGSAMVEVLDVDAFDGELYVIARYASGNVHHFLNGVRVTDWDTIADDNADYATLASYLADLVNANSAVEALASGDTIIFTAKTAGTVFTLAANAVNMESGVDDEAVTLATPTANVAAVSEVQASATATVIVGGTSPSDRVTDITVNGTSLMLAPVNWLLSHAATANAIATQINKKTSIHGYVASVVGAVITIKAAVGIGSAINDAVVAATTVGDLVIQTTPMVGGINAVAAVAQVSTARLSGTFESQDRFTITINGTSYVATGRAAATGLTAFVYKRRMWSAANSLQHYSKLNDAADWTDGDASAGAGFINVSNEASGTERIMGSALYGEQMAVFTRGNIHIFDIGTDADLFALSQTLDNSGSIAGRSLLSYGNLDVFYLDEDGERSLRAHETTAQAFVNDIGTTIDPFIQEHMATLPDATVRRARAILGADGRPWLAIGSRIFVLSYFPSSKVSGWTYYEPGFEVTDFARVRKRIYARAGNTIYLYGGASGAQYPTDADALSYEVSLPFLTAQTPATVKALEGFDIACTGVWAGEVLVDPNNEAKTVDIGVLNKVTYGGPDLGLPGRCSHMGFRFTGNKGGQATITMLTIYYESVETK